MAINILLKLSLKYVVGRSKKVKGVISYKIIDFEQYLLKTGVANLDLYLVKMSIRE